MAHFPIRDVARGFYSETITLRPRLPDVRGSSGAPGRRYGNPITIPAQIDPISGDVALMAGMEDIRSAYEVHLSADPGQEFDEGTLVSSLSTGPATVEGKIVPAVNHCVLVVRGRL